LVVKHRSRILLTVPSNYGKLLAMTTTRKTKQAGATFGQRLREERNRQGLSSMEVSFRIRGVVPPRSQVTPETIRNYEVGAVRAERVDLVVAAGLAAVLGVTLQDLSPAVAAEARVAAALLRERAGPSPK